MSEKRYDKIIIGAGIYGLYGALLCAKKKERVLVLEKEPECFTRATYVNQARVHLGYHYPRSLSTATATARYFDRFVSEYPECINGAFDQVYATSAHFSWTNAEQFEKFANAAGIPAKKVEVEKYFKEGVCDGAFLTTEVTFDAKILKERMLKDLADYPEVTLRTNAPVTAIERKDDVYVVTAGGETYETSFVLNTTYAGVNEMTELVGAEPFKIKYELCEVILCEVSEELNAAEDTSDTEEAADEEVPAGEEDAEYSEADGDDFESDGEETETPAEAADTENDAADEADGTDETSEEDAEASGSEDDDVSGEDAAEAESEDVLKAVNMYTQALQLLDRYDHQSLEKPAGKRPIYRITYAD